MGLSRDFFYDQYDNPRVPRVLITAAAAASLVLVGLFGYPNSLRSDTLEKVETELQKLDDSAYLLDGSDDFEIHGRNRSTTDGKVTAVVDGAACELKFDTRPNDVMSIYPNIGQAACAPLLGTERS